MLPLGPLSGSRVAWPTDQLRPSARRNCTGSRGRSVLNSGGRSATTRGEDWRGRLLASLVGLIGAASELGSTEDGVAAGKAGKFPVVPTSVTMLASAGAGSTGVGVNAVGCSCGNGVVTGSVTLPPPVLLAGHPLIKFCGI